MGSLTAMVNTMDGAFAKITRLTSNERITKIKRVLKKRSDRSRWKEEKGKLGKDTLEEAELIKRTAKAFHEKWYVSQG